MRRLWRPGIAGLHSAFSRLKGQDGQAAIVVLLLFVIVATFVLAPFLSQIATSVRKVKNEMEQRFAVIAAEAAIGRTRGDLIGGADGVSTNYTTIRPGFPATVYTITTVYTPPTVTVNDYTPIVTLSNPLTNQENPAEQPAYIDPGLAHPQLLSVPNNTGYLLRLYNVKRGEIAVNWYYSPPGNTQLGLWAGMPRNASTGAPYVPGQISSFPTDTAIDTNTSNRPNQLGPVTVDPTTDGSGGVYTIVFYNPSSTKTTAAFSPTGGTSNTWVYATAYRDYVVTATVGSVQVVVQFRQVPGYSEPPAATGGPPAYTYIWGIGNISFILNNIYSYTWLSP
ncbi:MAG: hypothetical protein HY528_03480 [Chloroflexi bacterium]|nr:hypothetical protein [Chloroflexota bacterium]